MRGRSLCRRADLAGDAGHRPPARAPSAARRRPQQLHAAPADAPMAQHVRQLLGDAAAAQHAGRLRAERYRRARQRRRVVEALVSQTPPGWASLLAAVLLLSGVQLLILGIVGEYLGRLYLTANSEPQSTVRSVLRGQPLADGRSSSTPPRAARDRVRGAGGALLLAWLARRCSASPARSRSNPARSAPPPSPRNSSIR